MCIYIKHCLIRLDCLNSDGLTGYTFSHEGNFKCCSRPKGVKTQALECAEECDKEDTCRAFHFQMDGNLCFIYYHHEEKVLQEGQIKAYVKC